MDHNKWETTNHKMMTKRDTLGFPLPDARVIPGYQGHMFSYRYLNIFL